MYDKTNRITLFLLFIKAVLLSSVLHTHLAEVIPRSSWTFSEMAVHKGIVFLVSK